MISKGDQTKEQILTAGVAHASVAGLEGISIGALATQMSMSKSGLYAHFNSKENLQVALLHAATARFIEFVVMPALKAPRGEPRVRELLRRWMAWDGADFLPGGCIFITAGVEFDQRPGPVQDVLVKSQRDWLDTLAGAARIAVQEGHFRTDLDDRQFASEAFSLAYGYHFISRLRLDPDAESRMHTALDRLINDARV